MRSLVSSQVASRPLDDSLALIAAFMVMGRSWQHQPTLFTFYLLALRGTLKTERGNWGRVWCREIRDAKTRDLVEGVWERRFLWYSLSDSTLICDLVPSVVSGFITPSKNMPVDGLAMFTHPKALALQMCLSLVHFNGLLFHIWCIPILCPVLPE